MTSPLTAGENEPAYFHSPLVSVWITVQIVLSPPAENEEEIRRRECREERIEWQLAEVAAENEE